MVEALLNIRGLAGAFVAGALIGVISGALPMYKWESYKLKLLKAEYYGFTEKTKLLGQVAEQQTKQKEAEFFANKEKADNAYKNALAALAADNERMRLKDSHRSFLPAPAASARSDNGICFDRTKLESAIQRFDGGAQKVIARGDVALIKLKVTQEWANGR